MEFLNQDLVTSNFPAWARIPPHRIKLLLRSTDWPRGHAFGLEATLSVSLGGHQTVTFDQADDPSTIYASLAVRSSKPEDTIPVLPYFPSYSGMSPEQRGIYLKWLCDITYPIDIGYVFVYYYGLERHLIHGDFEEAVKEIIILRSHHNNSSFRHYSASALVHACLLRSEPERLEFLYSSPDFDYFGNSNLLILYNQGFDLLPKTLIRLAQQLSGVNRKYLRSDQNLFELAIIETLQKRFGMQAYPFASRFSTEELDRIKFPIFANISLPDRIRAPALPNFLRNERFQKEMTGFFREVSERVKACKANKRAKNSKF